VRPRLKPATEQYRNQLVLKHLPLVDSIARRIHARLPPSFALDDLRSAGILGLIDAASRFKPRNPHGDLDRQCRAFAFKRVRGAILDSVGGRAYRDATHENLEEVRLSTAGVPLVDNQCDVSRLLAQLSDPEVQLLDLHYWQGFSLREAGPRMDLSRASAARLHLRTIEKLSRLLRDVSAPTPDYLIVLKPTKAKAKRSVDIRAQLIDELGALQLELARKVAHEKELIAQVRAWADAECKPGAAIVYHGITYLAPVTARGNRRRVSDKPQVFSILGKNEFLSLCGFTVETAEKHLSPEQFLSVITEDKYVSPRSVSTVLRSAGTAGKRKAA